MELRDGGGLAGIALVIVACRWVVSTILQGHLVHARGDRIHAAARTGGGGVHGGINLAQTNAAVLVLGRHLLPLLDTRNSGTTHRLERVGDRQAALHILELDKRHGDETRATQATDRLSDKPLGIGLGDDDDGFADLGIEFIGTLCLEVVLHDPVYHSPRGLPQGRHPAPSCTVLGSIGGGVGEARVVGRSVVAIVRGATVTALVFANGLEKRDGDETTAAGDTGIAGLVPLPVVFSVYYVEEITLGKGQFLWVIGLGFVVVEGFDDLRWRRWSLATNNGRT